VNDARARVAATVRPDVIALSTYAVAKARQMIKLDANESPFALPDAVRRRLAAALAEVPLNRYPDGGADALRDTLRSTLVLPREVALVLGNGSDELLQLITTAVAKPGAAVLAPEPTFVMYRVYAAHAQLRYVPVPLTAELTLDCGAMLRAIAVEHPALVWLASPNNPTGTRFDAGDIERIVRAAPGLVVIDEAYGPFASSSFLPRVLDFPNLVVVRTLSKIGMAGIRLGYAAAHPAWIAEIDKLRSPYNVNSLTQAAATVLLAEGGLYAQHVDTVRSERERVAAALARLRGVRAFPSEANFVLARFPDASAIWAALRDAGILVKNVSGFHPLLINCLRMTIGTPAENNALLAALERQP
jgi:histidinol-phosphate aminotransferase